MGEAVKVEGLRELSRNLKKIGPDMPKALRLGLNKVADLVVQDAKPRVPTRTGRAAKTLRAASTRTASRIRAGGKRAPYYPWLDFGGTITRGGRGTISRPFYKDGRYIYKSLADLRTSGKFEQTLTDSLLDVIRQAGIEVDE
ncbi:MAG TPA: HK97 gp10 family phage protein [Micromonosporaceae bacterium]